MILGMQTRLLIIPPLVALALTMSGCGQSSDESASTPSSSGTPTVTASKHDHDHEDEKGHDHDHEGEKGHDHEGEKGHDHEVPGDPKDKDAKEVGAREARLALTHDGGIMIVNAETMDVIKDLPHSGKNLRLRETGDHRYLLVDSGKDLETLDLGSWTQAHGEHGHSKTKAPSLTGQKFTVKKAGHVSPNADHTLVFDDGDGSVDVFHTDDMFKDDAKPEKTVQLPPHHGNADMLEGGNIVHTVADKGHAHGIAIVDKTGKKISESTECPGTHGAAVAKGGAMTFGCEDGTLLVKGGEITKIKAKDAFARMGNQYGSEESKYVFSDYKTSEKDLADQVAIVDTEAGTMKTVKLPSPYAWRGIEFTDEGQGVVLTQDGNLHLINAEKASIEKTIKVLEPFKEPEQWEKPSPTVHAQGHWVYVTDPASKKLHAIETSVAKVMKTGDLPKAPNEIDGTLG